MPRHIQPEDPLVAALRTFGEHFEPPDFTALLPSLARVEGETPAQSAASLPMVTLTITGNFL